MIDAWAPGRFRLLLLSLLLFFVGMAAATGTGGERLVGVILLALVIVAAVHDLAERGYRRRVAIALAGGAIAISILDVSVRMRQLPVLASVIVAVFAGFVVWRVYTEVMRPHRRVGDRIVGAICVYVLIGLAWAKVYETLDDVAPGSFRFPADTGWATPSPLRYSYFSFVTLATLGYGDVTPVTVLAGTLAWLEAITGQLYLAVTVARLVALSMADSSGSDTASRA
jgi:Ion channel